MAADQPTIVATSGGFRAGRRTNLEFHGLVHHAVDLSGAHGRKPRLCHIGTASGDQRWFNADISEAGRLAGWEVSHLNLFTMPPTADVPGFLGEHDVELAPGEAAEFDTRVPHWFAAADERPVELLSLFGKQGERAHLRARPKGPSRQ